MTPFIIVRASGAKTRVAINPETIEQLTPCCDDLSCLVTTPSYEDPLRVDHTFDEVMAAITLAMSKGRRWPSCRTCRSSSCTLRG